MKIESYSPLHAAAKAKQLKKAQGSSSASMFSGFLDDASETHESHAAEAVRTPMPLGSLEGMLAMQEVPDDEFERKKATRQANATLDALEDLRIAMVMGEVSVGQLERIATRIEQQKMHVTDPKLKAILNEIEVRAAVELAKLGR